MKKMIKVLGLVAIISMSMSMQVFAGEWKKDAIGWWYENDNKTYPVNTWAWLDGNKDGIAECYYFNGSGYCLMATTTPDNYTVDGNGAWTVNGIVQTQSVETSTERVDTDVMTQLEKDRQALRDMGITDEMIDQMINNPARHSEYGGLH